MAPQPVAAQGVVGSFLAARQAGLMNDFTHSAAYLNRLLMADPENTGMLEAAALAEFSAGEFEAALRHAERLIVLAPDSRVAALILLTHSLVTQDYARAHEIAQMEAGVHPLVEGLVRAWALMGQGAVGDALALFDDLAEQPELRAFALYCRSLALALVGDVEGALAIIENPDDGVASTINRRGYLAYAQLLGLNERYDDARMLIGQVFAGTGEARAQEMDAAFAQGQAVPFNLISTPAQGMAEVFAVMANAMSAADNAHEALLYTQAAVWVNPDLDDAQILMGQLFERLNQPEMADRAYQAIAPTSVFAMAGQMGRAQVLETLGDMDQAIEVLRGLTSQYPDSHVAEQVLGDFLRRNGNFAGAVEAYSRAFERLSQAGVQPSWNIYFSRAVAYERTQQWSLAEADFRTALEIEPTQPTVLNYLGYSLIERGENLDEALDMISRAVAGEPENGYIVDSLGWALFKLGRYNRALPHMERAVALNPTDAVPNDHLGDVYWAVGRRREARLQWQRALSFEVTDDLDVDRLHRKLEIGLDAVREEEGLPPLNPHLE